MLLRIAVTVNIALMFWFGFPAISRAAEIKCLFLYQSSEPCLRVAILGAIEPGDAAQLDHFLTRHPKVDTVHLLSPGGNLFEGMKIGRVIRGRFLNASAKLPSIIDGKKVTHDCGVKGRSVCCASACALAYFGGVQWDRGDFLGLHRPTLRDLGDRSYTEAQQALQDAGTKIKAYLVETEIEEHFYSIMMGAPTDRIAVVALDPGYPNNGDYKYPPSVHDWLLAKCRHKTQRPEYEMSECMMEATRTERDHRQAASKEPNATEKRVNSMPFAELERTVNELFARVRAGVRLTSSEHELLHAADRRLQQLRLSQEKHGIDSMTIEDLRKFGRENRGWELTKERVYKRIEELTGDRLVGDPSIDCGWALNVDAIISTCTALIDKADREPSKARAAAHKRRGDAYAIWKKDTDRAILDYTKAIELSPPVHASSISNLFGSHDLSAVYRARADALAKKGDLDGAIADYTKVIELSPRFSYHYVERGKLYEKKGDRLGAIANYKKLLEVEPTSDYAWKALARLGASP